MNTFFCLHRNYFQEETSVKLIPIHDETHSVSTNGTTTTTTPSGAPVDHEQLTREDLKYSVKIFLRSLEPAILAYTIDTGSLMFLIKTKVNSFVLYLVLQELKEDFLESVMISLPNYGSQLTIEEFLPLWRVVEDFIDKQRILSAGVSDFMLPLLSDLCEKAKVVN